MTEERYNEILASAEFQNELKPRLDHLCEMLKKGRASVMVGAGFSRNAEMEAGVTMKDWKGLARAFYKELYGYEPDTQEPILNDPLRLATVITKKHSHEYIDALLERELPDDKIKPGKLHKDLVNLSWADIYTTNYDTLLERAANPGSYNLVKGEDFIVGHPAPRIIKLLGSMPDVKPYIINERDYDDYKNLHPKLNNEIHGTLIRDELYLIGFSGDDPNFKRWINWLGYDSDNRCMAKIFLFEAYEKEINPIDSLYKESYGIETIRSLTGVKSIPEYFTFIFKYLKDNQGKRSNEWEIGVSYDILRKVRTLKIHSGTFTNEVNGNEIGKLIELYKNIRESYPGWFQFPLSQFENGFEHLFEYEISEVEQLVKHIQGKTLINFLYEFEWRLRKAFYPPSILPWYIAKCEEIVENVNDDGFDGNIKLLSIAVSLLTHYRLTFDISNFESLSARLEQSVKQIGSLEISNRFLYETALQAVSVMDYSRTHEILNGWNLIDDNYEGCVWKSALLIEINREPEAYELLRAAILRLKNDSSDLSDDVRQSYLGAFMSVFSLYSAYKGKSEIEISVDSSFEIHSYFRFIKARLYDILQNAQNRIESRSHGFNLLDVNKNRLMDGVNRSSQTRYAARIQMIWEQFGYPYRMGAITINSQLMQLSCDVLLKGDIPMIAFNALVRAAQTDTSNNVIKKETLVELDKSFVNNWIDILLERAEAITDWEQSTQFTYRLCVVILIIASRLSAIIDIPRIKRIVPLLLKVYIHRNYIYKNEYLITVFNSLPSSEYGYIVRLTSECPIKVDNARRDIWIPQGVDPQDVALSDNAIDLVLEAFNDPSPSIKDNAYTRATYIYEYCTDSQKGKLDAAIRNWRTAANEVNASFSFNLINPEEENQSSINERFKSALKKLKERIETEKYNDGSIGYSGGPEDDIETLYALKSKVSNELISEMYSVLATYMRQIVLSFENENTKLTPVFGPSKLPDMKTIAKIIFRGNPSLASFDVQEDLYNSFERLYKLGYPRYAVIEKLNPQSSILEKKNLFKDILSVNEDIRKEALRFMVIKGFSCYKPIWNMIWDKVLFCTTPEIIDYLKAILGAGKYSEFVLPDTDVIVNIFRNKAIEIDSGYICEGDRFDIIYQLKMLAGYISNMNNIPAEVHDSISSWKSGAEMDEQLPNDVKLGFEEGVALWKKHQNELDK